jgi:hypothetical protein
MTMTKTLTLGAFVWLLAGATAFADVRITMQNGRVTLVAKDATVRQILTEWARVGQTKIVNVERIPGGPVSLELQNVPEAQALDVLLRTVAGYLAAPRPTAVANLSLFDRIVVMPAAAGTRAPVATAAQAPTPTFQQPPQFQPPPQQAEDDGDDPRPTPNAATPNQNRAPIFNTFPQPQVVNPQAPNPQRAASPQGAMPGAPPAQQPAAASPFPSAPAGGVAVPGMVAPAPQPPPGQQPPLAPGQVRRPGGPGGQ